ncbi:MAG: succinate dehydrogenase, hydrophobic rane anchor protein [Moraxellaceae bacterium]|jgi:succinate dehydrogenase / fumarate reductase membrane anchor subunit|nr:succinate dehydrogenase, hydrophobic rane anchor protein [Moraxellaceae bacterium]
MRNSATSLTRNGIADWLVQRVSAYILGIYFVVVLGFLVCNPGVGFDEWKAFMLATPMRIFTLLSLLALIGHSWVGMWTVLTDYVTVRQMGGNATFLRAVLLVGMVLANFVFLIWGIQILWGN